MFLWNLLSEDKRLRYEKVCIVESLNPCFCGIYSQRLNFINTYSIDDFKVLILVFVEFTLRGNIRGRKVLPDAVLILVFVEFTLREAKLSHTWPDLTVLILVFVEFTLRDHCKRCNWDTKKVLILVFVEFTLRAGYQR